MRLKEPHSHKKRKHRHHSRKNPKQHILKIQDGFFNGLMDITIRPISLKKECYANRQTPQ